MSSLFSWHGMAAVFFIVLPFVFYTYLWKRPQQWVQYCGRNADPSHKMAQISHGLKILQISALVSVAPYFPPPLPPWFRVVLFVAGQFLNFRTYDLLGEAGVYYGSRFGKKLPWVEKFPFGYIRDPQYWGSIMTLLSLSYWLPFKFILPWILGYFYLMILEREENPASRKKRIT